LSVYIDASVLVSFAVGEGHAADVRHWLNSRSQKEAVISPWCDTEVCSALGRKLRMHELSVDREAQVRLMWRTTMQGLLTVVPTHTVDFHHAADLCARPDLKLRAPDALHLAVARRLDLPLATFDTVMAEAAAALAIPLVTLR
jgi:uncharacterized protein